ncbi:hypothetical protein [Pigmentibacter ruber]|uniref:hypothetical protein n=1 Tax=Pigmentibacter ruber TaxID=2683196 RepID=UPI00131C2400|nr:hypothetical protein [Pigmentibacter ruber]BFD32310.1 hypothetical protein GTC16762_19280 [Pigmentibacter ruber]
MFISDIDLQNKSLSRIDTLSTSNFIQLNQDSIIDSAVCTTLCVLLDIYLRKKIPYNNCVHVFFNNIKINLTFIKSALKNQKNVIMDIHKKQQASTFSIGISDIIKNEDYFCKKTSDLISLFIKNIYNDITKKKIELLNTYYIIYPHNKSLENVFNYLKNWNKKPRFLFFSFTNNISITSRRTKGYFIHDGETCYIGNKNLSIDSIYSYSEIKHSCYLIIDEFNYLFYDPNYGILHDKKSNIDDLFKYIILRYDMNYSDNIAFIFNEIEI